MLETLGTQPDRNRPKSLRDRYRGTLLGLAVGNALGLPVESWSKAEIRRRFPGGIREVDPAELDLPWDDDLAQAVIIAEAILEHDTLDRGDLAARLTEWASSNGRGMGSQTRAVINALRHGMAPSEAARVVWEREGGSAAGNGAVMRCAPVAMRWRTDETRLREESERSAEVTHHDPRCGWSAYAVNLAIAGALGGRRTSIDSIARALVDAEVGPHTIRAVRRAATPSIDGLELDGSSSGFTLKAMQVGLWCLENGDEFEKTLLTVVHAGGDTDTNGAVAGAVLGAIHGVEAIPDRWVRGIPRAERLLSIADRLLERSEALPS